MQVRKLIGFCCGTAALVLVFAPAAGLAEKDSAGKNSSNGRPSSDAPSSGAAQTGLPNSDYLVREVVYNELHDHDQHGYWRYWIERQSNRETQVQEAVETPEGPVQRLELTNGRPISVEAREEEERRIQHLLNSSSEQAQHRKEYADDEHRIGRILALLPDAFIYEPAQVEGRTEEMAECPCYHLRFHPNPDYPTHSIESRIFHAMAGDLWISVQNKRLVRLDGRLQDNVDFGYGILGRLYKDGWFRLERTRVGTAAAGNGDWKTQRLEVHMIGRAMLFKTIARETSELRGGFSPVPAGLSLQQAAALASEPMNASVARPASLVTSR